MANAKTPKTTAAPAALEAVSTLIREAGEAAASMVAKCREAAKAAEAQLDPKKPIAERHAAVMALYNADFHSVDHNVKAIFGDALLLVAAGQAPVSIERDKGVIHTTAVQAVDMGKHDLRKAASAVRADNGMGRKTGGGRKPATSAAKAEAAVGAAPDVTVKASAIDQFTQWLDAMPEYLNDVVYHPRIVAALVSAGYSLTKAPKGRQVTPK
jgi:hypothetical protein